MQGERQALLRAADLVKVYGFGPSEVRALDGVSLDIYEGELFVILGSSPDGGHLFFDGREVTGFRDRDMTSYRKKNIGFVFQSFNLIAELTVRENVALTADTSKNPKIIDETLEMMGLWEKRDNYPAQLSGGQQQRVSIARALAKNSRLLLCDEPTGALDYETGKQILIQLEELCRVHGRTVVIVTHTQEIGRMADRVIRMRNGKIISETVNDTIVKAESIEW